MYAIVSIAGELTTVQSTDVNTCSHQPI